MDIKLPIKMLAVAQSNYGKTYQCTRFIKELMQKKKVSPKRILIFSKTYKHDPAQQEIVEICKKKYKQFEQNNCFTDVNLELLINVYEAQEKIKTSGKTLKPWLIMIDDLLGSSILKNTQGPFINFVATCRHMNISLIFLMQTYKNGLSTVSRGNCTCIMVGAMPNVSVEAMLQDWTQIAGTNKKEALRKMEELYNESLTKESGRGFLIIYPQRLWGQGRVQIGSLWSDQFADINAPSSDGNSS